ncbi:MAG: flagellar basal body-associated FliL family protein [Spirochaetaceae bacterium]|nr:flagellar basal body-associated FliL family protein [Spirochaetaceae bacterium]
MSDTMDDDLGGSSDDSSKPKKRGKLSGGSGLVKILTVVVGAILVLVFTVTVSVIVFTIMNRGNAGERLSGLSNQYIGVPDFDFAEPIEIRGRTNDRVPRTFVVTVVLGYRMGETATSEEIMRRRSQLQDLIRSFFSEQSVDDFAASNENQLKAELEQRINRILSRGSVSTILFTNFMVDF